MKTYHQPTGSSPWLRQQSLLHYSGITYTYTSNYGLYVPKVWEDVSLSYSLSPKMTSASLVLIRCVYVNTHAWQLPLIHLADILLMSPVRDSGMLIGTPSPC